MADRAVAGHDEAAILLTLVDELDASLRPHDKDAGRQGVGLLTVGAMTVTLLARCGERPVRPSTI
jgi:hypothetical protein